MLLKVSYVCVCVCVCVLWRQERVRTRFGGKWGNERMALLDIFLRGTMIR